MLHPGATVELNGAMWTRKELCKKAIELDVQVDETALQALHLGLEALEIGARGQVQRGEKHLEIAIQLPARLLGTLQRRSKSLADLRISQDSLDDLLHVFSLLRM